MWLEKFIFCGKTVGLTSNTLKIAETLATCSHIPLGKHLLGSVYYLLHQVVVKLRSDQPIDNLGGPWWFIQLWLNMYMHKTLGLDLRKMSFPSETYAEGQQIQVCQCTSFGESTSMIANEDFGMKDFFKCFYNGFADESIIWFAYHVKNHNYENPVKLQLDNWKDDEDATKSLKEAIAPWILPANSSGIRVWSIADSPLLC